MELKGRVFMGRYEAKSLLGEGGMGRVYLAHQYDLNRTVVIKVMHDHIAADPKFRERFEAETLLMAQFQHPYAVTLYDATLNDPEGPCIVMEYIRGLTLEQMMEQTKGRRLQPARIGRLLGQLCEVLQMAHQRGIIHRDLKPANIMIVEPDSLYEKIKVMDFGLAKLRGPRSLKNVVEGGVVEYAVGTPAYMSPEQVRGEEMDHRGDLYSVGVILFEVLTGRLPFIGSDAMDVLLAHATDTPPRFADIGIGPEIVSPAVEAVIQSCLAKDRNKRPASARDLFERYQEALNRGPGASSAQVDSVPELPEVPAETAVSPSAPVVDPTAVMHVMEAWMPETIAAYKLRGFVHDAGGDVLENVPGRIRVQLGKPGSAYTERGGALSWLGLGRKAGRVDMELRMEQADPSRKGLLRIIVLMRSPAGELPSNPYWRLRCDRIFCDLRGYLMGKTGGE